MATLLQRSAPQRRESLCQEPRKEGNSRNTADYDSTQPGITTKTPERRGSWKAGSVGITEKIKQVCDEAVKADKTRVHGRALAEGRKQVRKSDGKCNESRNKQKKCVCEHCEKQPSSESRHNVHVRLQAGSMPFQCCYADCRKNFHDNLLHNKRHLCWHRNKRSYFCGQCGKGYFSNNNLKGHMHVHTKIEPFSCNHCGKPFALERIQNQHVLTHTLEKPY